MLMHKREVFDMASNETQELLSCMDAAVLIGCHPFSLRRYEEKGQLLPLTRVGGRRVYERQAVLKFKRLRARNGQGVTK